MVEDTNARGNHGLTHITDKQILNSQNRIHTQAVVREREWACSQWEDTNHSAIGAYPKDFWKNFGCWFAVASFAKWNSMRLSQPRRHQGTITPS